MKALLTLVVLLLVSLHLHLWFGDSPPAASAEVPVAAEARPILLEESTLRSLVRDEVARGLAATSLSAEEIEALGSRVTAAIEDGLASARIRETIAEEYVAGYYDALAEIDRLEAARAEAVNVEEAVLNNLRQLAAAAQQFMLDEGVTEVFYEDIVGPNGYFPSLSSVAGERYRTLFPITTATERLAVRLADGRTIEYRF